LLSTTESVGNLYKSELFLDTIRIYPGLNQGNQQQPTLSLALDGGGIQPDISTLAKTGHFYFGLITGVFCLDV
jgi:hypothetical protein